MDKTMPVKFLEIDQERERLVFSARKAADSKQLKTYNVSLLQTCCSGHYLTSMRCALQAAYMLIIVLLLVRYAHGAACNASHSHRTPHCQLLPATQLPAKALTGHSDIWTWLRKQNLCCCQVSVADCLAACRLVM